MSLFGCTRLASRSLLLQSSKIKGSALGLVGAKTGEIHKFVRGISHLLQLNYNDLYNFGRRQSYLRATFLSTNQAFHATAPRGAMEKDYYVVLGVSRDASQDDIKKAFLTLAKKYHPDTNNSQSARRKFQEIRDAYEILRDPSKRAQYDQRSSGEEEMRYTANDAGEFRSRTNRDPFSDDFYKIFSQVFENERDAYADDIEVVLKLSFAEAAKGTTKQCSFKAKVLCDSCDGRGHSVNAKRYVCPNCDGLGKVTVFPFTTICDHCRGAGRIIKDFCLVCKGVGVVDGTRTFNIQIPAGVDSGDTIQVAEVGNNGRKGVNPGNLFIKLEVEEDPVFVRDGPDIYVDTRITFTQAILGGKVEVPTLSGKTQLTIPKGVQPGQYVVLRGKGLPRGPKEARFVVSYGDQYVRFRVHFPSSVNERQRAILEEFALEEATKEKNEFAEENWWQRLIGHLTISRVLQGIAIVLLINLVLGKTVN
ncbi:DNAJ heat shock family protein isoform X1 [Carex rostrata]